MRDVSDPPFRNYCRNLSGNARRAQMLTYPIHSWKIKFMHGLYRTVDV